MTTKCAESRKTRQRQPCDRWNTERRWRNEKSPNWNHGKGRKACGRYPCRLYGTREGGLVDSQLVTHVSAEAITDAELFCNLHGEILVEAACHVDRRKLVQFGLGLAGKLLAFPARCPPALGRAAS